MDLLLPNVTGNIFQFQRRNQLTLAMVWQMTITIISRLYADWNSHTDLLPPTVRWICELNICMNTEQFYRWQNYWIGLVQNEYLTFAVVFQKCSRLSSSVILPVFFSFFLLSSGMRTTLFCEHKTTRSHSLFYACRRWSEKNKTKCTLEKWPWEIWDRASRPQIPHDHFSTRTIFSRHKGLRNKRGLRI